MPLDFPVVDDVRLANPPLTEVLCQVRFPPILRINQEQPIKFQETIRARFPELEEETGFHLRVGVAGESPAANAEPTGRAFHFRTADRSTLASLSMDAFSVSTSNYSVWSEFAADLNLIHQSAMSAYKLPYAKRIGLRYINTFDLHRIGCNTFTELQKLLRPELTALMTTSAWNAPEELVAQVLLRDNDCYLVLRVATRTGGAQPPIILLDFDYYEEGNIPLHNLVQRCDRFHDIIYRAFRWALRSQALDIFSPMKET